MHKVVRWCKRSIRHGTKHLSWTCAGNKPYYEFGNEHDRHFIEFLHDWFDRDCSHSVYCRDLDWLDMPEAICVVDVLKRHHRNVKIFVHDDSASICNELRNAGIAVIILPAIGGDSPGMSMLTRGRSRELTIRRTATKGNNVRLIRTSDEFLLGLAEDLFTLLEAQRPH